MTLARLLPFALGGNVAVWIFTIHIGRLFLHALVQSAHTPFNVLVDLNSLRPTNEH